MRPERKLSARIVATWSKPGRLSDGGGLYLSIDKDGRRRWVFIFTWQGKAKELGLGGYPASSLLKARDPRDKARDELKAGRNPIDACHAKAAHNAVPTFGEVATNFIAAKAPEWRSGVHISQWSTTLETHAALLWDMPVDQITTEKVLEVLKPIWTTTP